MYDPKANVSLYGEDVDHVSRYAILKIVRSLFCAMTNNNGVYRDWMTSQFSTTTELIVSWWYYLFFLVGGSGMTLMNTFRCHDIVCVCQGSQKK